MRPKDKTIKVNSEAYPTLTCSLPLSFQSECGFFTESPHLMSGLEPPPTPSQDSRAHP